MKRDDRRRALSQQIRALARCGAAVATVFALACERATGPDLHISRVEVNLAAPTLLISTTSIATARAFDINGAQVPNADAAWASDNPAVVSVNSRTGVLTGKTLGSATISATVGRVRGTALLTVVPLPVATVDLSPPSGSIDRGQSLQFHATVKDPFGVILTDRTVNWTSSAPGVASVSSSGLVNGIAAGTAVITAQAEDVAATVTTSVIVTPVPGGPAIATIAPDLLVPGATVTITGTDFGATPVLNEVRVAGVLASIQSADATTIVAQLPATGFGCEPTRQVFVQVAVSSVADAKLAAIQVAPQRPMQPGDVQILSNSADARCFELGPTGGDYVVSVYNTGVEIDPAVGFRLRGASGILPPGFAPLRMPSVVAPRAPVVRPRITAPSQLSGLLADAGDRAAEAAHARVLQANLDFIRAHGSELSANLSRSRAGLRTAAVNINQPVGTILSLKIPNIGGFGSTSVDFCTSNFPVSARIVYSGTHSVVVEDVTAPFANQMDTLYQQIGTEFDNVMFDIVKNNFGDPLRMDDVLDGNGKILMLFSPKINTFSSIAGFVVTCDFGTVQQYPSSNHTEVFYARVPTDPGTSFGSQDTRAGWYRFTRSTIVHEVKHIASFATRIRDFGQSAEEPWLEEGLARHAEEIWSRASAYNGLVQSANANYGTTLYCDVRPNDATAPQCAGKPWAMIRHFGEGGLYDYLANNETHSMLGPRAGEIDGTYYASAWSMVRWALDNHAVDEAGFLSSLVHTAQNGVGNLTTHLGRPWEEVLGEWSLAMFLDDYPGFVPSNTRIRFPSWNLRGLYQGLHNDFCTPACSHFPLVYPLVPRSGAYGDFNVTVPEVAGGSFSLFLLNANQSNRQLLQLLGLTTSDSVPKLRVAIARID